MKILLIDRTVSGQTHLARRIESIDRGEKEALNISIALSDPEQALERVAACDVAIIGVEVAEAAPALVRQLKTRKPDLEVMVYVDDNDYSSEVFRLVHGAQARRVFVDSSSILDLLQELVGIQEEFCAAGKIKRGRLIVVTQVKGGLGATTLAAALAETLAKNDGRTITWDLDIETRDLTRGLGKASLPVDYHSWLNGTQDLCKDDVERSLESIDIGLQLLPPPVALVDGERLVGTARGAEVSLELMSLLKFTSANVVVDTAGRLGPQARALISSADAVLCLFDDSALGLSGVQSFLEHIVVRPGSPRLFMVGCNTRISSSELLREIGADSLLDVEALTPLPLPFDPEAARWPGTGRTLFSRGKKRTVQALLDLAALIERRGQSNIIRLPQPASATRRSTGRPLTQVLRDAMARSFSF